MSIIQIIDEFINGMRNTGAVEYVAVATGIISVWYSRKESILTYPIGLINTILYVYLSYKGDLLGEASVNFYYTIMNIYGWYEWTKRANNTSGEIIGGDRKLKISSSDRKWWTWQLLFFAACYIIIFFCLVELKKDFAKGSIPWADAFASATAFTGMWLMTKKKVESWYWWIATNIASIPLYFVKHYVFTSVYYLVLLVMAIFGLIEWQRRKRQYHHE